MIGAQYLLSSNVIHIKLHSHTILLEIQPPDVEEIDGISKTGIVGISLRVVLDYHMPQLKGQASGRRTIKEITK